MELVLAKGELTVSSVSAPPEISESWLLDRKHFEIRKWLNENFVTSTEFDYDFSDWDNDDDLEDDDQIEEISARQILFENFGKKLNAVEFEALLHLIDDEYNDDWRPVDYRIDIDEVDDDDEDVSFLDFSDARRQIPLLLQRLSQVQDTLFPHLGHNNPPEGLQFTASELEQLSLLLAEAQAIPDEPNSVDYALLDKLGAAALRVGSEIIRYVAKR